MGIVDGKIAIVTGSGRGVGRGEAMELAAQGAKVVVCDPGASSKGEGNDNRPADDTVEIINKAGGEAVANYDDISTWDGAANVVRQAIDAFGGLDIVVNNAGILRDSTIVRMSEADWDGVIGVHLKGTFNMTRHACEYWSDESKAGRARKAAIVNTVSSAGLQGNEVPDGEYERLNPGNSAPMVVWLASDESMLVSGQVFRAVGSEIAHYLPWHIGPSVANKVKGEDQKWDPARIGTALAKNVFGLQPGGLQLNR